MNPIKRLHETFLHQGRVLRISVDDVLLPNGNRMQLELVQHPGASAVVAIDHHHHVILVQQARYATGEWLVEIPAGHRDGNEDPMVCAARELEEETGYKASTMIPMGFIWVSPGFCSEKIWLFLAKDLVTTQQHLDSDEILNVMKMPFEQAIAQAQDGTITDAKSVCGLLRAQKLLA